MGKQRVGEWFQSLKGRKIWPFSPNKKDVDIEEIAQALSNICRFGGHIPVFYSVAQHSCNVMRCVEQRNPKRYDLAIEGLLHDATEAYLGDMVGPLKHSCGGWKLYTEAEKDWGVAIGKAFGLGSEGLVLAYPHPQVIDADISVLLAEKRDLLAKSDLVWPEEKEYQPWHVRIKPWPPNRAKQKFLEEFDRLAKKLHLPAVRKP
jgi:hypothetical protein